MKKVTFLSENVQFLKETFSIYLNRCVFLMNTHGEYPEYLVHLIRAFGFRLYILQFTRSDSEGDEEEQSTPFDSKCHFRGKFCTNDKFFVSY